MTEHTAGTGLTTTEGDPGLAYLDVGPRSRRAVVFLHSLGADHRMWSDQVAALAADRRVIVPDSRGHGASVGSGPASFHDWVGDLERIFEHAGTEQVALVGISMGGVQAMAYAADFPDRVSALVIADSFAELTPEIAQGKISGMVDRAHNEGMAEWARSYVAETFTTRAQGADVIRDAIAGMDPATYAASVQACFGAQLAERLGGLRVPTLVLWGDRDRKTPRELSEHIATTIPAARLGVVPDAGHLSNLENPDAFTDLVRQFLSTEDTPGNEGATG
jgi:3-oxoadipate enol-lactonase